MKIKILLLTLLLLIPYATNAQTESSSVHDELFKAEIIEIIEENDNSVEANTESFQQKLKLIGLDEKWKGKEIISDNMDLQVVSNPRYEVGDKVLVSYFQDINSNNVYYVTGPVRQGSLYWLALIFALVVIAIGRWKGLRSLAVLLLTFLIILKFIVPKILTGNDPLFITIIGSLIILTLAIYITEGLKRNSTIAIFSVLISLIITGFISIWFTGLAKLTGFASEEAIYLTGLAGSGIDIKGLLLAGIIIGALGVLDDVVIAQVVLVKELKISSPEFSKKQIYAKAMRVGVSHLSSMINTLFLAYAGAALPLLILFSVKQPPFLNFNNVINNEIIATEIVRSLAGSIGIVLAVPISTLMAVWFGESKKIIKTKN
ncbi:YibE/F family protein [Patescibacteria group bacterium]|nr:YibE/F family protein [Patescibacteria group bacterium]MBU1896028.1 YibE/F family protein [Patescibacteria group bacterium]